MEVAQGTETAPWTKEEGSVLGMPAEGSQFYVIESLHSVRELDSDGLASLS